MMRKQKHEVTDISPLIETIKCNYHFNIMFYSTMGNSQECHFAYYILLQ